MFAPNSKVLQETIEKINELTTQEVLVARLNSSLNYNLQTNKGNARHWRANCLSLKWSCYGEGIYSGLSTKIQYHVVIQKRMMQYSGTSILRIFI